MSSNTSSHPEKGALFRRLLRSVLFVFGGTAIGLIVLILLAEPKFIYFPTRDGDWQIPAKSNGAIAELKLKTNDGQELIAWYYKAAKRTKRHILFCHGNAGNLTHRHSWAQVLVHLPANVLLFDYRGYGVNDGTPTEQGIYADATSAYEFLVNEKKVASKELFLYGTSLGGGPACELAMTKPCAGLILQSTFTSAPDMAATRVGGLPLGWFMRTQFANKEKMPKIKVPVFITHSKNDELIPFSMAEELFSRANEPKTLLPFSGPGHNTMLSEKGKELILALQAFLASSNK